MVDWPSVRLHVVTGKGGTGKSTVAAALALALASDGRQVLLCEVEGRQGIARMFDVDPLPYDERRIATGLTDRSGRAPGSVYALHIDAESALLEYLSMYYRLGRAGKALDRFGVIEFATTIAPGVRDVLLTGKVYEAARRNGGRGSGRRYDAIVLDAPPTGRIAQFLGVNQELAGLAKMGPIKSQADSIMTLFRSERTAVHLVTVLEEMPVQETADGIAQLRAADLPVGGVVVNQVRPQDLDADDLAAARDRRARPGGGGPRPRVGGHRGERQPRPGVAHRGARPRRAARARGRPAGRGRPARRADVRAAPAGVGHRRRRALRAGGPPQEAGDGMTPRTARPRVGPLASIPSDAPALDVDALLDDPGTGIIVCCGSGGVGKTTTSAALALRAAERGRKVVVLTIDPARRLAQSMGIEELDNTPRPVAGVRKPRGGERGSLDAMMLDMKRTFDEVVESQATPEKARQILQNPFYIALSSSFAGTQEYMAMEKLGQIHRQAQADATYDLIVVDTPPSRSALDFLDAPERLSSFLDGRFIRVLLAPAKGPARLMTAGLSVITNALTKVLGAQILRDMQTFVAAFDTLFGGFRARAEKTFALLQAEGTAFLVVAAPEPDAMREAAYFVERLGEDRMPLAGLVVNRASAPPAQPLSADESMAAAARLGKVRGAAAESAGRTSGLLRLHADRTRLVEREALVRRRFAAAHPDVPTVVVPALASDVHDLAGLRRVGALLAGR